jgi:Lrp/AsnC family transcriptional regulator, leucine-responsive regulatory protein
VTKQIDSVDRRILEVLQVEGRLSNVELADRVNLSPSPCLRRVKALEANVITGYHAELDRPAIGLGLTVFVEVKVSGHTRETSDRIEEAIANMREVVSCHLVSGAADFLLQVVVPDLAAYERFLLERLLTLPSVQDVRSNFAIRTVKARGPLPMGHLG